ncbi:MAG: hypothetical protein JSU04_02295 [Bdellovibrionales bacterium]|nr:hypothetical protein [Bdellovibrionales bacterium]
MKHLIVALTVLFSMSAHAVSKQEAEILETVIKNANLFTVTYSDGSEAPEEYALPKLISDALLNGYFQLKEENTGTVGSLKYTYISCDVTTDDSKSVKDATVYDCTLTFGQGEFTNTDEGFTGPDSEGQVMLSFSAVVPNNPRYEVEIPDTNMVLEIGD